MVPLFRMNRKTLLILALLLIAVGFIVLIHNRINPVQQETKEKISVVTSFYPLYFFTSQIAQEHATVINITPAGAEPHDYEPNTQDIATIEQSDLVILNGAGLEAWGEKIQPSLILSLNEKNGKDPHTWLDPILAKQAVEKITNALVSIDPQNEPSYQMNSTILLGKLDALDASFKQNLSSCKQSTAITSHAAFGYLAARYGFSQISISGISPDDEPSPQKLAEITKLAKTKGVHFIFFETLVSPRLAETIAQEIGAKTLVLDPIEGVTDENAQTGKNYFTIMKDNLTNLRTALECK